MSTICHCVVDKRKRHKCWVWTREERWEGETRTCHWTSNVSGSKCSWGTM